ncbi:DUF2938 domain-containing protein [Idiomarina sp. M1R2S28]|uniref:DUF2938 domain-containing protein n=1 Tax=Idiomarina rhizosphaerae TaxID=2961572 RepID=A0A9X2FUR6_9GAMM|nr:DUF2938 domain-containing protein [Idiomarina rhizosphaerae]MCP1339604.1 DUF2938 domain-containing protein [Idiomarina rhizosphaerae]
MNNLLVIVFIGFGATAVMDLWSIARKSLFGIPLPNYGMVGRWIAHMPHGQFRHNSIAKSCQVTGEHIIGWTAHYLIGTIFAALLIIIWGESWVHNPTITPALLVGIATVLAPFLIMQPGMGAGIAASKTHNPASARLHSLITHTVFGFGLYVSGWVVKLFYSI